MSGFVLRWFPQLLAAALCLGLAAPNAVRVANAAALLLAATCGLVSRIHRRIGCDAIRMSPTGLRIFPYCIQPETQPSLTTR